MIPSFSRVNTAVLRSFCVIVLLVLEKRTLMSKSQKYNVCDGQSYFTLLVQQVQDAEPSLDQVDTRLVISKIDQSPGDLLLHVLLLLQLEHMLRT